MQDYLTDTDTSVKEKIMVFKWRVRMENFGGNYRGGKEYIPCPLCNHHDDSQLKSFECPQDLIRNKP